MVIDDKTRSILTDKLQFTPQQIVRLEHNSDLLSRTLGLLELIKRASNRTETKPFVLEQLKRIRQTLSRSSQASTEQLMKARAEYYTFQKITKWSRLSRRHRA